MNRFLIAAATVAAAAGGAVPASAQILPQPYGYNGYNSGYGGGYNNGYGYNQGYGNGQQLQYRIAAIRQQVRQLSYRRMISPGEARGLEMQARGLQYRVQRLGYNGINPRERSAIEDQISHLEQQVRHQAVDHNGYRNRNGYSQYQGYNQGYNQSYGYNPYDRDRDNRDDRYEDDRGRDHDDDDD